jgi:hypothetical protein
LPLGSILSGTLGTGASTCHLKWPNLPIFVHIELVLVSCTGSAVAKFIAFAQLLLMLTLIEVIR